MSGLSIVERLKRGTRVYGGRASRSGLRAPLRHPCAFMHVPKCGGTSVSEALYALVPLHREVAVIDSPSLRRALAIQHAGVDDRTTFHDEGERADEIAAMRETLLIMHMAHGARLVHGHFLFSEAAWKRFGETYRYVTILRDPIARTVSNYRMAHRNGVFAGDLDAFLDSAMGRRMAQHALRYFAGTPSVVEGEETALLERAKDVMERFAVIGFLEDLLGFADRFADVFGARPAVGHANRGAGDALDLTPAQRTRLEALCAPDIALNEHARSLR